MTGELGIVPTSTGNKVSSKPLSNVERVVRILESIDPPSRILGRAGQASMLDYYHSKGQSIDPAIPVLITLLGDQDQHTRDKAAEALLNIAIREIDGSSIFVSASSRKRPVPKVLQALIEAIKTRSKV